MPPEEFSHLLACLPADLQGSETRITRVSAGLSGAGVYRVDTPRQIVVLKVAVIGESIEEWRRKMRIQHRAANAGLAPRLVHIDEARRAIVSEFIVDRSFPAFYANPATREAALALLGETLRRVHQLPLPANANATDPREFIGRYWPELVATFAIPSFVISTVETILAEERPPSGRDVVLSHNDVNPTNLVYDGTRLLLFDWDAAGPNDPYYDLAAISVFLRMDDAACQRLLTAYEGEPVTDLPPRFAYDRRLAAALCGTMFLHLARAGGHPGATGTETLDATPTLGDFYQRMRSGEVRLGSADGNWAFGLALVKASGAAIPYKEGLERQV